MSAYNTSNDPMRHHSGKPRLGPLNVKQLEEMLKTARPKNKVKIQRALDGRKSTQSVAKVTE
jgi:hypothetical protein